MKLFSDKFLYQNLTISHIICVESTKIIHTSNNLRKNIIVTLCLFEKLNNLQIYGKINLIF